MDKYQQVISDYASNRKALNVIKRKIQALAWGEPGKNEDINLACFRDDWYGAGDEYGSTARWEGWAVAVGAFAHKPKELALAKLLDERNKINREAGQIKRNMCAYGRAILKRNGENK